MKREFQISTLAVVVLVLLRIGIGWHFLHEGIWKAEQPNFSAAPYLRQARGPLANWYRGLIPDFYGERRLDVDQTRAYWTNRLERAQKHFGYLPDDQLKAARDALETRLAQLDDVLREDKKDAFGQPLKRDGKTVHGDRDFVAKYKVALAQWKQDDLRPEVREIPSEQKRHADKLEEMQQEAADWLSQVDRLDKAFSEDLHLIASPEVREAVGDLPPETTWLSWLEPLTTYSLIAIGLCLMLGFATRLAAVGGTVFLLTAVIMAQLQFGHAYPPLPPSAGHTFLVTKEVIEMLALLAIALTPAGRWGGLDYIGYGFFGRYYESVGNFIKRYVGKAVGAGIQLLQRILRRRKTDEPAT